MPSSAPGYTDDACSTCHHDAAAATAEFAAWRAAGNELREPLVIEHSDEADGPQIALWIVEDLEAAGIDAVGAPYSSASRRPSCPCSGDSTTGCTTATSSGGSTRVRPGS